jgi:WhiB family redox-sensing transcriptional regulator
MNKRRSRGGQATPACREYDPDIWFPVGYTGEANLSQIMLATLVCASCPLRIGCLEYALSNNEGVGIWGGLTPEERRGMRGVEGGKDELHAALATA